MEIEQLQRWRLILGKEAESKLGEFGQISLNEEERLIDQALAAIYDNTSGYFDNNKTGKNGGKGGSSPMILKWLGDVRTLFSQEVVSIIQKDAIERKGLKELLFEPETMKKLTPNIQMVATLLMLKNQIPERTKETARELVRSVVEEIKRKLESSINSAVSGVLNRKEHSNIPSASSIDWKKSIEYNLKNYNNEYKKIIPERFYFFEKVRRDNNWTIILDIDQSGSMAESVIYSSVAGAIFSSIPAFRTRVVAFDTQIVDLTEQCLEDPVDMLFGIQLGGGTDINKSVAYCQEFITEPTQTIFFLITDLFEGGNSAQLLQRLEFMKESGVKVICMSALSDSGQPSYDENMARKLAKIGITAFACTPNMLPDILEQALKGGEITIPKQI